MNLPNSLSIVRICLVPLFVAAYFLQYYWGAYVAVGIFILAAATDFLDGYIARKYNLVTDLGKLLDPIADKILICAALFCLASSNPLLYFQYVDVAVGVQEWETVSTHAVAVDFGVITFTVGAILIISRELLISAVRQIAASKGVVVQANVFGKVKTVFQDVSLLMLVLLNSAKIQAINAIPLGNFTPSTFWAVWWWASIVLFIVAVVLTVVSGVIYLVQNRKVFSN